MRMSQMFGKTLRQDPAEAETASHRLMLKAGLINQVAAGVYSYLPLAHRAMRKIEEIIRHEMDFAGAQELKMPALQPLDLWKETGRDIAFGDILFRVTDRRGRSMVIGPTHEEVMTLLVHHNVRSYRDLPVILYQIQTKFRDETRPRAGLVRGREFEMKDAYSFDIDEAGLDTAYDKMLQAYRNVFTRCGLPYIVVEADSGAIGGKDSHEFIIPTASGEDSILLCKGCGYAANAERAISRKPVLESDSPLPLEEVHTPGVRTIAELSEYLDIPQAKTIKTILYTCDNQLIFTVIRGDLDINEVKLKNFLHCDELRLATDGEIEAASIVAGFASPIDVQGIRVVADESVYSGSNFVAGANQVDYHVLNANPTRDFQPNDVVDISLAAAGHGCAHCGAELRIIKGIEAGHLFKLGTSYSNTFEAFYLDDQGRQNACIMGCYGLGVSRVLAAAVEKNHDSRGIIWPAPIAPYQVQLLGINLDSLEVARQAEDLYNQLSDAGLDVLYDDRAESPGVKFNDADLMGMPVRLVVSHRTLAKQVIELRNRAEHDSTYISLDEVVTEVQKKLYSLES